MKYAIVGAGAMGSILAGFMARAGQDVTLIARGRSLTAIREHGLKVHTQSDGDFNVPVRVVAADDYDDRPDAVILCVKSYSLSSIYPLLERVCEPGTIVLSILNAVNIGSRIASSLQVPVQPVEGVAYVVVSQERPGEVTKKLDFFRMTLGMPSGERLDSRVSEIRSDFAHAGIDAEVAENMTQAALRKFVHVSTLSAVQVYYDTDAGGVRENPEAFELLTQLGNEVVQIAEAAGMPFDDDPVGDMVRGVLDVHSDFRTSLAHDAMNGSRTEFQTQFFDIYDLGRSLGLPMDAYGKVSARLGYEAASVDAPSEQPGALHDS